MAIASPRHRIYAIGLVAASGWLSANLTPADLSTNACLELVRGTPLLVTFIFAIGTVFKPVPRVRFAAVQCCSRLRPRSFRRVNHRPADCLSPPLNERRRCHVILRSSFKRVLPSPVGSSSAWVISFLLVPVIVHHRTDQKAAAGYHHPRSPPFETGSASPALCSAVEPALRTWYPN